MLALAVPGYAQGGGGPGPFTRLAAATIPKLQELSGIYASRTRPGLYWGLNDSGHAPELLAFDAALGLRQTTRIEGAVNQDWEDLAGFQEGGKSWLVIADTGDNFGLRTEYRLIFVAEPGPGLASAAPARVIRFGFEGGARDCEAIAVDVPGRRVLLADKGRRPAGLYELALDGSDQGQVAHKIAEFPDLVPAPAPRVQTLSSQRWRGTPTAMDLSADGRRLIVLTYQSLNLFVRAGDADWDRALATPLRSLRTPRQGGFEALAFEPDERSAVLGTEGPTTILQRWKEAYPP